MRYYFLLFLVIAFQSNSLCLGITNERKKNNSYIIDVSSDDLPDFTKKLYSFLNKVKNEFYIFLFGTGVVFIFTYVSQLDRHKIHFSMRWKIAFLFLRISGFSFFIFALFITLT